MKIFSVMPHYKAITNCQMRTLTCWTLEIKSGSADGFLIELRLVEMPVDNNPRSFRTHAHKRTQAPHVSWP